MRLLIDSTTDLVLLEGHGATLPARVWTGHTEHGIPVTVYVPLIRVQVDADQAAFEAELRETSVRPAPSLN
jgi:hypothetical protein